MTNAPAAQPPTAQEPGREAVRRAALAAALLLMLLALLSTGRGAGSAPFGHSGGFEIFLFLSGFLLAPGLLRLFQGSGARAGLLRVAHRLWQVYWRYLGAILASSAIALAFHGDDVSAALAPLSLEALATGAKATVLGLSTLMLQPAFFGALPTYFIVLALCPVIIGLGLRSPIAALGLSVALYALAQLGDVAPEAWALDPLGWQLAFFAGFAFGAGWIRSPKRSRTLTMGALAILALSLVTAPGGLVGGYWRESVHGLEAARAFGPARALSFAALIYLAAHWGSAVFDRIAAYAPWLTPPLRTLGDQSLVGLVAIHPIAALFAAGLGVEGAAAALCLLPAAALLILCAAVALWFEKPPWAKQPARSGAAS